jgi:hypothetical protein
MRAALLAVLLFALFAAPAAAQDIFQEGQTITVELMNGDKLTGLLEQADGAKLVIRHDILGRLEIARASIKPPAPPKPAPPPDPAWAGKFDVALSGSEGNTTTGAFRTQLDLKHDDAEAIDTFTIWYARKTTDHDTDEEKSYTLYRHEWRLEDSLWRPFVQGSYDTDQFTDFNSRLAVAGGAAYQIRKDEEHDVTGRLGAGVSKKFGISRNVNPAAPPARIKSIEDSLTYEALFGLDWAWTLSELSKFTFVSDLYPSINPSGEYRSVVRLAYENKFDADSAWFLKLGTDRFHDSDPGAGKRTSEYNYYLGVGRTF